MSLIGAGMGMSLGLNAIKSGYGLYQMLTAKKPDRPTYTIPGEAYGIVDVAERQAYGDMPGRDVIEGNIKSSTSQAYTEGRRQGGRFDVGKVHEQQLDSLRNLGLDEAAFRFDAERNLMKALGIMADYEDKAFQYNEADRYNDEQEEYYAKMQSGMENLFGGGQSVVDSAFDFASLEQSEAMWDAFDPDFLTRFERKAKRREERQESRENRD
jgi:hypothetical protein